MKLGTLRKFLGLDDQADAYDLLGIEPDQCTVVRIDQALRRRIAQVYAHQDGRGPEGSDVCRALRAAADSLKADIARSATAARAPRPVVAPPPLAEFDRHVLATLVAYGGWNAGSRTRLVALAGSRGATVQGLIKVIRGLSEFARRGGGRVGVAQITSGRPRLVPAPVPPSPITQFGDRLIERLVPDLKRDREAGTRKLSLFFGTLAILIAAAAVTPVIWPLMVKPSETTTAASAPTGAAADLRPAETRERERVAPPVRPTPFTDLPTFADVGVPRAAMEAAAGVSELIDEMDEVARRLIVSAEPSEAVYRKWEYATGALAGAWPLLDSEAARRVEQSMSDVLLATAGRPVVTDRIMSPFAPTGEIIMDPLDVWRGAWRAGTLARISRNHSMPPALSEHAARLLEASLGSSAAGAREFGGAADAWLRRIAAPMVDRMSDDAAHYLAWELWLAAQRRLGTGRGEARFDRALMHVIRLIAQSGGDLSRQPGRLNLAGRLLRSVSFSTSFTVREMFLELLDHPGVSASNLWVLSSILAQDPQITWYGGEFVIPYDASRELRRRYQYDIERAWPPLEHDDRRWAGRGPEFTIDDYTHRLWLSKFDEVAALSSSAAEDHERIRRLLDWARLNEAAALMAAQRPMQAERPLHAIPTSPPRSAAPPTPSPTNPQARRPPGLAPGLEGDIGPDGAWASRYEEARRSNEERLRVLESLRAAGRDLEPRNAAVLVREAYRAPGGSAEVRAAAQRFVAQQFSSGRNVSAEMLDQFPEAPRSEATSEFLQHYTKAILPPARASDWAVESRRALLEHALRIHQPESGEIDRVAGEVAESYDSQSAALRARDIGGLIGSPGMGAPRSPTDAARRLVEAWRDTAVAALVVTPFPDDVAGLDRRHTMRLRLADGPMQEFIASQAAVLELLTYLTASEQPGLIDELAALVKEAAAHRRDARSVLEQAVVAEEMISRLWRLRLGPAPQGFLIPPTRNGDDE